MTFRFWFMLSMTLIPPALASTVVLRWSITSPMALISPEVVGPGNTTKERNVACW
jgi:hypothetical protein